MEPKTACQEEIDPTSDLRTSSHGNKDTEPEILSQTAGLLSENSLLCNGRKETDSPNSSCEDNNAEVSEDGLKITSGESRSPESGEKIHDLHDQVNEKTDDIIQTVSGQTKNSGSNEEDAACDLDVVRTDGVVADDARGLVNRKKEDLINESKKETEDLDLFELKSEVNDEEICVTLNNDDNDSSEASEDDRCEIVAPETSMDGDNKESLDNEVTDDRKSTDCESEIVEIKEDTTDNLEQSNKEKDTADSEKENRDNTEKMGIHIKDKKVESSPISLGSGNSEKYSDATDTSTDDVEIIGETKIVQIKPPKNKPGTSQNVVFVPSGIPSATTSMPLLKQGFTAGSGNLGSSNRKVLPGITTVFAALPHQLALTGSVPTQNTPVTVQSVSLPKPNSSLDQIERIRWEIENRVNTRPKYFKPSPSSELGPLAKFLFDIGSDLIKEAVYHDLVKIQSKKNEEDKLSAKEKEDLVKLKEIEKDLFSIIGHLKQKMKKRCRGCNFQTESENVMFNHKQYPHEDNKNMRCAHCDFATKQAITFKFHLESEHAIQPKLNDKKAFYECELCPYENNQEQKLILHKQRCVKQFRPSFNLHPSCLSGAEISLCLENIFYKPVIPKSLKLLQQRQVQHQAAHAQHQAALSEARRQQAQMQALAAQKAAASIVVKKPSQQLPQKKVPPIIMPRFDVPQVGRLSLLPKNLGQQPVRFNSSNQRQARPTIANILNKQNPIALPSGSPQYAAAAGGFEVCEICGGYVKDRKALRIHFFYAHRVDLPVNLFERNQAPLYCATCYVRFWTAQGLRKHIESHKEENQTRGVVGKCISCGHHVLNLLLHMRIVHNRELQHYVNALMCMFCGSHFASRQDCERHIINAHGHVDPITGSLKSQPPTAPTQLQLKPKQSSNQKKSSSNSFMKGSICVLCNLNFGRNVDLTRHCMRMHHTCMKCGMVVIDKPSLLKHTCLSSLSGTRDCSLCGEIGFHPAYYVKHLRDKHLRKFTIKVGRLSKNTIERWTKRPCPFREPVLVEISDSDDEDVDHPQKKSPAPITSGRRTNIGPASKTGRAVVKTVVDTASADSPKQNSAENEVIELDSAKETSSADEDSRSHDSSQGQKRKLESPESRSSPKRKKSS